MTGSLLISGRIALTAALLAIVMTPIADAAPARTSLRVTDLGGIPGTAVAPRTTLTITGTVENTSRQPVRGARISIRIEPISAARPRASVVGRKRFGQLRGGRRVRFAKRISVGPRAGGTYRVLVCAGSAGRRPACEPGNRRLRIPRTPPKQMRAAMTRHRLYERAAAFQKIADVSDGNRASGTPGYDRSVAYVVRELRRAGYKPRLQHFTFEYSAPRSEPSFRQVAPAAVTYRNEKDFYTAANSGSGNVSAPITPVAVQLGLGNVSASGCDATDFAGFPAGHVALVQRGTCAFDVKVGNAQNAGATAVVIFNQGETSDAERQQVLDPALDTPGNVPVLGISYALGAELAQAAGPEVAITTDMLNETRSSSNVIAETPGGRRDHTIIVGSHLDSVEAGPGINDNGSGSGFNLELAVQMAKLGIDPVNRVRFAFWGAEEIALDGSTEYVARLGKADIKRIAMNLNFDMLASPNYGRLVYDGNGDESDVTGPPGSGAIERAFISNFDAHGLTTAPVALDARSDYAAFMDVGIPVGGVFSGADDVKSEADARRFGGTAGLPFDPNYHLASDTLENLNMVGFEQMAKTAAEVTTAFALDRRRLDRSK